MSARTAWLPWLGLLIGLSGCATIKQSDTSRTGVEQLLISSAVDRSLNKVDFRPIARAKVYIEPKYLDCVDKNYILLSLHQHLLAHDCTLVDKPEDSDVTVEIGSGAVGTDRKDVFLGVPEISLPGSQIALPRLAMFTKTRSNGTAKLALVAFDSKSRKPVINQGTSLARSDHNNWSLLGAGPVVTGSVPNEILAATGESESVSPQSLWAKNPSSSVR